MDFKVTIGLETHVQLKTRTKIWCGCPNVFGSEPNTDICPVCLGYPGALPVLNREAVKRTVLTGLMLNANINLKSKFDRKSYFYPDMPKNYQITQYDQPFCAGGAVDIEVEGLKKSIGITRIHLEEDVGKNLHFESSSGVDFNRAGTPLMEIVSEPEIESADEAFAYLVALKQILLYGGISDCNLEEGNIRCDINCSVRPAGQAEFGVKTEIKNMNTFKGVHRSLVYEIKRQIDVLSKGGSITQETRRWDDEAGVTRSMRSKEYAHDYRYFPDPDLVTVSLAQEQIDAWRSELPELPAHRRERLIREYELPDYDAGVIVADKAVADYFEETARLSGHPKAASNWIMTDMLRCLSETDTDIRRTRVTPRNLADLIQLIDQKVINRPSAREIFALLFERGGDPKTIVEEKGLAQVSDTGALDGMADEAIAAHPQSVADYRQGKKAALQFLTGQVMRLSKGKANPQIVNRILREKLGE